MKKYIVTVLLLLTCVVAFAQVNKSGVTHKGEVTTTKNQGEVDKSGQIDPCPQLTPYGEIISYTATMDTLHGDLDGTVNIAVSIKVKSAENADSVGFELSTSSGFSVITAHKSFSPVDTILYKDTFKLLQANQTYYVRAFIANCPGVVYSDTVDVTTTGTYTLSFFAHGGTGTMTDQNFGDGVPQRIKRNEFTRSNADFAGWTTDISGCGTWYADTAYMTLTASDSVYAQWKTWCTGTPDLIYEKGSVNRIDSVKDHQDNWYKVVQIGSQCWLAENMRATTSPSTNTNFVENLAATASFSGKKAYYIGNSPTSVRDRGLLYNWNAAVDTFNTSYSETHTNPDAGAAVDAVFIGMRRGICPSGWHIPTDAEWNALESTADVGAAGIGKLAGGCEWTPFGTATQAGNYAYSKRDSSCFKARATGFYNGTSNDFESSNGYAGFWSATRSNVSSQVWNRAFGSDDENLWRNDDQKKFGYSVRCVRDEQHKDTITFVPNGGAGTMAQQIVYTDIPTPIDSNLFTHAGNWEFAGWRDDCSNTGVLYANAENIITNGHNITLYAQWHTWCNNTPVHSLHEAGTSRIDSLQDIDGNWYQVVSMADGKCWMRQNLRTTKYANGEVVPLITDGTRSVSLPYRYCPNNQPSLTNEFGYLYNWTAILHGAAPSSSNPSNVQGICPTGWHLPSDAEWNQMESAEAPTATDISTSSFSYQAANTNLAVRLSQGCWWLNGVTNSAGDMVTAGRNESVLSVLPSGAFNGGYGNFSSDAFLWTSTYIESHESGICRHIGKDYAGVQRLYHFPYHGFAVRCVRDVPVAAAITFDANSGTGYMAVQNAMTMTETVLDSNEYRKTHATFAGWNTERSGCGTAYADGDNITLFGNITLYAQWKTYCTGTPAPDVEQGSGRIDSVQDHEGNWYKVLQIGTQCWLAENMRATTSPSTHSSIVLGEANSFIKSYSSKCAVSHNNSNYGILYNWCAAIDSFLNDGNSSHPELANQPGHSSTNWICSMPAGYRQGICPRGWHIPTDTEWKTLEEFVGIGNATTVALGGWRGDNAGRLTGGCAWSGYSDSGLKPNSYSNPERNQYGFSAIPAGLCDHGGISDTVSGYFWTATSSDEFNAFYRHLSSDDEKVGRGNYTRDRAFSVRCVRDTD